MDERRRGPSPLQLMIVVAIVLVVVAVSLLHLLHSKVSANESMARESLHAYNLALWEYFTIYETYPKTLANLGPGSEAGVNSADLIDPVLASGKKNGYVFAYAPGELDFDGTTSMYNITAAPRVSGVTGRQSFSMDQTGVVHASIKPSAAESSPTP
jgi:type II secretory pathway pseudopilin PulG